MDNPLLNMEDAKERLVAWKERADRLASDTQAASEELQHLSATASDDNDIVAITLDSSGTLIDIRLSSRVQRQAPSYTEATILETYQKAKSQLAEAAAEVIKETLGTDSATGHALLAGFAPPPVDPPDRD